MFFVRNIEQKMKYSSLQYEDVLLFEENKICK